LQRLGVEPAQLIHTQAQRDQNLEIEFGDWLRERALDLIVSRERQRSTPITSSVVSA
jgi:hypothetical protein